MDQLCQPSGILFYIYIKQYSRRFRVIKRLNEIHNPIHFNMKTSFSISLLFTLVFIGNAQLNKLNEYMPSAEMGSLVTATEVPVSLFTGIANYPIDLYTIEDGDLNLPIRLNYYASGVKLDEHPGWVGLNWNLQAGGAITRVVSDLPDDYDVHWTMWRDGFDQVFGFFSETNIRGDQAGYYFNQGVLPSGDDWYSDANMQNMISSNKHVKDTEPDKFIFNFNGISGEFYLDGSGEWTVRSDYDLKVEFSDNHFVKLPEEFLGVPGLACLFEEGNGETPPDFKSFGGFTITTFDGFKYYFGVLPGEAVTEGNLASIEYSVPFFLQQSSPPVATSWKLTKIVSPKGRVIDLDYQRKNFTSEFRLSFEIAYQAFLKESGVEYACNPPPPNHVTAIPFGENSEELAVPGIIHPTFASIDGSLILPSYLDKISSSNVEINFELEETNELEYPRDMIIKNHTLQQFLPPDLNSPANFSYVFCRNEYGYFRNHFLLYLKHAANSTSVNNQLDELKWYQLSKMNLSFKNSNYDRHFDFDYSSDPTQRLFLKGLSEKSSNNEVRNNYSFEYYGENLSKKLPEYISEKTDHWGFLGNESQEKCLTRKRWLSELTDESIDWAACALEPSYRSTQNNINAARLGSLKRVTLPTGGFIDFDYEQNSYNKSLNIDRQGVTIESMDKLTGGIRIKTINRNDGNTDWIETYDYHSSGIHDGNFVYSFEENQYGTFSAHQLIRRFFSVNSYTPTSVAYSGTHIGYSKVSRSLSDGSKTTYYYTNYDSDVEHYDFAFLPSSSNIYSPYQPINSKHMERGKVSAIEMYDDAGIRVFRESNSYIATSSNRIKGVRLDGTLVRCTDGTFDNDEFIAYNAHPYEIYIYKYNVESKVENSFDQNVPSRSIQVDHNMTYVPGDKNLLRSLSSLYSNGDLIENIYKYPLDF